MDELSADVVKLLVYLLPGFTAAWLFYGVTSHPKPSQFERVVQALIFTFVVQVLLAILGSVLLWIGKFFSLGEWNTNSKLFASLFLAVLVGATIAYFTNSDKFHQRLRSIGFTTRTSHPSEWYCVFSEKITYVVLHLKDGRWLYGWPKEWPVDPHKGQFYIQEPSWIDEHGKSIELPGLDGILIKVEDVERVEFLGGGAGK